MQNKKDSFIIEGQTFDKNVIMDRLGELYTEIVNADDDEDFIEETPEVKKIQYEKAYELFKHIIKFAEQSDENLFYILHKQRIFNEEEYLHITQWDKTKQIKYPQAALRKHLRNHIQDIPLRQSELNKLKLKEKKQSFEVKSTNKLEDIKTLLNQCKNLTTINESKYSLTYKTKQDSITYRVTESLMNKNKMSLYCYIDNGRDRNILSVDESLKYLECEEDIKLKIKLFFI